MPLGPGVRYRMGPHGVRLAFRGNKVVEAKNTKTGAIHTESEFAADEKGKRERKEDSVHTALMRGLGR